MADDIQLGPNSERQPDRVLMTRRTLELICCFLILMFGLVIIWGALEFEVGWGERGPGSGYFPFWIGIVIVIGCVGTFFQAITQRHLANEPGLTQAQVERALTFVIPLIGFLAITSLLGLYVGMAVYLLFVMSTQGGYGLLFAGSVSIATLVFFFVVFEVLLKVPLMKGPIEALLGIH